MRMVLLLTAAAAALSACSLSAQGATPVPSVSAAPSTSPSAGVSVPAVPSAAVSSPAAASPSATSSAGPSSSPSASPTSSPAPGTLDPAVLGGPAPVGSFVLGDSISLSAGIGPVLGRYGYPVVGLVGQSVSDGYLTTHLSSPAAQAAPAWVIELGTNNRGDETDVARLTHYVDLIDSLRTPGAKQRVLWVTPYRPVSSTDRTQSALDDFTAELGRQAAQHPWLRLIDFATVAKAHTDWFDADAALHIHPDADGQGAMVALIAGPDAVPAKNPMPVINAAPTPTPQPTPTKSQPPDPVFDNSEG